MSERRLKDLKIGDKLVCLRILETKFVFINLKITNISSGWVFSVVSDKLDRYTFYRKQESIIKGLRVILSEENDDQLKEYLFETLDDCKIFAEEYCKTKIANYEETIQRIKDW